MTESMKWFVLWATGLILLIWTMVFGNILLDNVVDKCWKAGKIPQQIVFEGTTGTIWECK